MSQFKLQKVTKVKGPSELSMLPSESAAKKSSRAPSSTDRPQTAEPRQKKSTSKAPDDKQSSSEKTSTSSSRSAPRTRPTAAKRTTSKTCPSQQSKRSGLPQTASKQTKSKAPGSDATKKQQPVPAKSHIVEKQTNKPAKNLPKKESNYDASGSDSDENELSGKLSPKDDVGYETGSFDEVDASSSETTSPAASDENKSLLNQTQCSNKHSTSGYSYADLEFRPLIVTDEGGVSAPIDARRSDTQHGCSQERLSYAYAGNEYRPLIVTDEGGFASPVKAQKSHDEKRVAQPSTYEEIEIHSGKFDRANANLVQLMPSAVNNYIEKDNTQDLTERTEQNSRQQDFNVTESKRDGDVYATVQKDRSKNGLNLITDAEEIPPQIPRKEVTRSDLYEHVTGQLQSMIEACDEDESDNTRPPLPQPYSGPGISVEEEEHEELVVVDNEEDCNGLPLYAAVQKKPRDKHNKKQSGDLPPPIPSRSSNLIDTLVRDMPSTIQEDETKHSNGGVFKKKHRRNISEGNIFNNCSEDIFGYSSPNLSKRGHRRSKSQADIATPIIKERSDSGNLIKPYLEVDITEPPNTPTDLRGAGNFVDDTGNGDLPEGWKEVESDNGAKYYWHISSGTTQWERPQVASRPKVLSFPIHSMGWIELEENQVAPHNMSDTIADCISSLANARKDLWKTSETWGEGKDIRLLLEGDTLKLVEPRNKITLLVQPVSKMRVWGVGKEDHRDFAYVARDPNTSKHKCHMYRCHGNISGRAITTALHEMCNRILEEKKRAQENSKKSAQKPWSDIINTPPPPSAKDHAGFNEKPVREQRKDFTATYLGCIEVPKPSGMEMLNRAISKVASRGGPKRTVLIQVTVSCVKLTDCTSQEEIAEDRVRYLSFMGIGKDDRLCGYVMANEPNHFLCHVFQCSPNAAALAKSLEEACQLRYQKCLDAYPEMAAKAAVVSQEVSPEPDKSKDKSNFMSSMQGLFGKLATKKAGGKKEDVTMAACLPKPSHTFMVKYYGALPVAVGTGVETIEEAAKHLTGGTLLICQLDVAVNGVTLFDSQRSALSRRHMDADTISYCGLTSDTGHFGLIQCQGGGKYVCHVFSEYKTRATPIVAAIHETL